MKIYNAIVLNIFHGTKRPNNARLIAGKIRDQQRFSCQLVSANVCYIIIGMIQIINVDHIVIGV